MIFGRSFEPEAAPPKKKRSTLPDVHSDEWRTVGSNPVLAAWREARRRYPKDHEAAVQCYRDLLDESGSRTTTLDRGARRSSVNDNSS